MSAPFPADPFRGEPPALDPSYTVKTSIFHLGLMLTRARATLRRIDEETAKRKRTGGEDTIYDLMIHQADALDRLIPTLPAMTLADAAVQVEVATTVASDRVGFDWTPPEAQRDLNRLHLDIYRLVLSALPIVAEAAKVDAEGMQWDDTVALKKHHLWVEGGER